VEANPEQERLMRLCSLLFYGLLFSPNLFLIHEAQSQQPPSPTFSISLHAAQSTAIVGAPVKMDITLTNTSKSVIVVAQDKSRKGDFTYAISVRDAAQKEAPWTDYHRALNGESTTTPMIIVSGGGPHRLEPGESMVDTLEINDLYDLRMPGKYTVQVERTDSASKNLVKSNLVTLTITQ
jgi:hypothetical protein